MTSTYEIHIAVGPEELELLFAEIRRYLDAVHVFRDAGHEPSWRIEVAAEVPR